MGMESSSRSGSNWPQEWRNISDLCAFYLTAKRSGTTSIGGVLESRLALSVTGTRIYGNLICFGMKYKDIRTPSYTQL